VFKYCKAVVITAVDVNFWNVSVVTDSVCLCTLILTLTTNIVCDFPWSDMLLLFTFEKYLLNIQDWITRGWLLIFFQVYHKFYGEKKKQLFYLAAHGNMLYLETMQFSIQ
jgi:hypothetical protein